MTPAYDKAREYPRYATSVSVFDLEHSRTFASLNLSEGGFAAAFEKPPYVGEVLRLQMHLGEAGPVLEVKAEVIWRKEGDGCGFRFFKLTAKQREILRAYLADKPPAQG